jgi:hypothetical protein
MIFYESFVLEEVWDWWLGPIEPLEDEDSKRTTHFFVLSYWFANVYIGNQKIFIK